MAGDDRKRGPPPTPMSRTATLDDPLTTQVLAEIARRAQTMELDPEALANLARGDSEEEPRNDGEDEAGGDAVATAHPRVRGG